MKKNAWYRTGFIAGCSQDGLYALARGFMRSLGKASRLPEARTTKDQPGTALESSQHAGLLFAVFFRSVSLNVGNAQWSDGIEASDCQAHHNLLRGVCPPRTV
jgi:hypothetical protein